MVDKASVAAGRTPARRAASTVRAPAVRTILPMKMRKKSDLPSKTCAHCALPFTWRKKWARDWEQVKYCSERCRRAAKPDGGNGRPA